MISHLLDTNIVSYLIRRNPPKVVERLERLGRARVAVSVVTAIELREGAELSTDPRRYHAVIDRILDEIRVLPLELKAAEVAGRVRAQLRRKGQRIGDFDSLIASHALSERLVLVTHNAREFVRVNGLTVENWVS